MPFASSSPSLIRKALPLAGCIALAIISICIAYSIPTSIATDRGITQIVGSVDQWACFVPEAHFLDAHLHSGELPMWNPYVRCGAPFAARPHSYMFYPPNFLRSVLTNPVTPMNTHIGLTLVLLLHVIVGAVGTYLLAREHKMSYIAAVTASLVFILSGGMIRRTMSNFFITTIVWMPFIFICVARGFATDSLRVKLRYAVAAGFLFGLSLLSGSPHMTMHLSLSIAVYGVVYRLVNLNKQQFDSAKRIFTTLSQDALFGVLIIVIGGLMSSAMMVPTMEYSGFSHRGTAENIVHDQAFPYLTLLKTLVSYSGDDNHFQDLRLAGLGVSLLAMLALTNRNWRSVALYAVLFWVFIDITFGPPRPWAEILIAISPYQLSSLSRGMMWACFPLAMLAGFGIDAVVNRWRQGKRSIVISLGIFGAGMVMLLLLDLALDRHLFLEVTWPALAFPFALVMAIAILGMIPRQAEESRLSSEKPRRFTMNTRFNPAIIIAALVLCELFFWTPAYVGYLRDWLGYKGPTEKLWAAKDFWNDNHRMYDKYPNASLVDLDPLSNGYDPLYIKRSHDVLFAEERYAAILYGWMFTDGNQRGNLFLKRPLWLSSQYAEGPLPEAETLFPPTTTVFLSEVTGEIPVPKIERAEIPNSGVSAKIQRRLLGDKAALAALTKIQDSPPRNMILAFENIDLGGLHSTVRITYTSAAPAKVTPITYDGEDETPYPGMTFDLKATGGEQRTFEFPLPDFDDLKLVIEVVFQGSNRDFEFIEAELLSDLNDEDDHIEILSRKANSIDIRLSDLPGHRILTYHDALYPYWHAFIDGEEVAIHLANEAYKAIVVPPGTHDVRFEFRPTSVYVGIAISIATVAALMLYALWEWRSSRRESRAHSVGSV